MSFTGQLGTAASSLGNIQLGAGAGTGGGGGGGSTGSSAPAFSYSLVVPVGPMMRMMPFIRFLTPYILPRQAPPPDSSTSSTVGPVDRIPIRGVPWLRHVVPILPSQAPSAPARVGDDQPFVPAFPGPPLNVPWRTPRVRSSPAVLSLPGAISDEVPVRAISPIKTLIQRDPNLDRRTGRSLDIISQLLNSLIRQGIVVQTDADKWTIDITAPSGSGATGHFTSGDFP